MTCISALIGVNSTVSVNGKTIFMLVSQMKTSKTFTSQFSADRFGTAVSFLDILPDLP